MQASSRNSALLRQTIQIVQMSFPQIYLACHTRHQRKRSNAYRLSARDSAILAHLDRWVAIAPSKLATHLGVSRSTLSEALKRLATLGLVAVPADAGHVRRRVSVVLTEAGAFAIGDTSVLETPRLEAVLSSSTPRELKAISTGISTLARVCRFHSENAPESAGHSQMRYVLFVAVACVLIAVVVLLVGWMLPVSHRATREATYRATPADVFGLITDIRAFSEWRPSVKQVEVLPALNGHSRFREIGRNGSILYEIDSLTPNRLLVTRIADRSLPFGGQWTYELLPSGESTTLRITEDGEVYNPLFRFISRFVIGHTATVDQYLSDVGRRFGPATRAAIPR
jgi:DNA-binding MarR family transcriptional regulator/uncharacterized protein YndB with AHSA1/START domain